MADDTVQVPCAILILMSCGPPKFQVAQWKTRTWTWMGRSWNSII